MLYPTAKETNWFIFKLFSIIGVFFICFCILLRHLIIITDNEPLSLEQVHKLRMIVESHELDSASIAILENSIKDTIITIQERREILAAIEYVRK